MKGKWTIVDGIITDLLIDVNETMSDSVLITPEQYRLYNEYRGKLDTNFNVVQEIVSREEKLAEIEELKGLLAASDYKAIKYAEGELTEYIYAPIREQRRAWREAINILEAELYGNPISNK